MQKIQLKRIQDHLHIRGENRVRLCFVNTHLGSPPHTWRKLELSPSAYKSIGITSTYVEKTKSIVYVKHGIEDHLHIRGENGLLLNQSIIT